MQCMNFTYINMIMMMTTRNIHIMYWLNVCYAEVFGGEDDDDMMMTTFRERSIFSLIYFQTMFLKIGMGGNFSNFFGMSVFLMK